MNQAEIGRWLAVVLCFMAFSQGLAQERGDNFVSESGALMRAVRAPGIPDNSIYAGFENNESVSLFNGNLLVSHPSSPSYPLNGGGAVALVRTFNSRKITKWRETEQWVEWIGGTPIHKSSDYYGPVGNSWVGTGWTMHLGRVFKRCKSTSGSDCGITNEIFEDSNGTEHQFAPFQMEAEYFIRKEYHRHFVPFVIDEDYYLLTMPNGTQYKLEKIITPNDHNIDRHGWYATEITDVHGNQILVEYWGKDFPYPEAIKSVSIKSAGGIARRVLETTLWEADTSKPWISGTLKTLTAKILESDDSERVICYSFFYEKEWNTPDEFLTGGGDCHGCVGHNDSHLPLLTAVSVSPGNGTPPATVSYDYTEAEADCLRPIIKLTNIKYPTGGETDYQYHCCPRTDRESSNPYF